MPAVEMHALHFGNIGDPLPGADQEVEAVVKVLVAGGKELVLHLFRPRQMLLRDSVRRFDLAIVHRVETVAPVEILEAARKRPEIR